MAKPASQTTLLQIEATEPFPAGALCSVFQDRLLVPSFGAWARFRTVCALLPGDLILIPEDGDGHPPELSLVNSAENYARAASDFRFYVSQVYRPNPIFDISSIV